VSGSPAANAAPEFDAGFRAKLADLVLWRRDVRKFRRDRLPDGSIDRLLRLACLAPSVGLSEPWRFVLVEDPAKRRRIRENFRAANAEALASYSGERAARYAALKLEGLDDAPVQLAAFADPDPKQGAKVGRRTMPETVAYSVVTAIHTLWLAARAEGIGVGWVSILDPAPIARDLEVPLHWRFIGYFCVGYPIEVADTPELERVNWQKRADPQSFIFRR
jgi:5,6-dimethylbenzimidazole synthase